MKIKGKSLYNYLSGSYHWKDGYKLFRKILGNPLGWFYYSGSEPLLRLLSRRHLCKSLIDINAGDGTCQEWVAGICRKNEKQRHGKVSYHVCKNGKKCAFVPFERGELPGYIVFCNIPDGSKKRDIEEKIACFVPFLNSEIDSYRKLLELQDLYDTIQPRAMALSSLHSVNRVISSALSIDDLIPKIGRLFFQILKADYCAIFLIDEKKKWLVPHFAIDSKRKYISEKRVKIGRGVFGKIAEDADCYISRYTIAFPLIDDDVIGVIVLKKDIGKPYFSRADVEVLGALSKQAVFAIHNSRLLEEHEKITMGSIKSISNILDINMPKERIYTRLFSMLVFKLVKSMDLPSGELVNIERAATLLDAGHLGIPENILNKKGSLTKNEYKIIKQHPYRGVEILRSIDSLKPIIPIILYHHERYDGKGYPEGLKGDEIPIGSQIIAVVVAFMAMITDRPYRKAMSIEDAIEEIKNSAGTQFNPVIADKFIGIMQNEEIIKTVKETVYGRKTSHKN